MISLLRSRSVRLVVLLVVSASLIGACGAASAPAGGADGLNAPSAAPAPAERDTGGGDAVAPGAPVDETKIVRTGTLTVRVGDVTAAVASAGLAIDRLGGYIGASRQALEDDRPVAQITYRIPVDRWDDALAAFRGLGKVLDEQTEAVEVAGQLIDLEARIENLRASERALQAIASSATRISDVLEVQERLFQVRGEIEQLSAQQAHLEDQASYGTLTVTFGVEVVAITEAQKDWDASAEVDRATASLVDVLQAVATAGIWFAIVWLPILIVLAVVAIAALMVLRRMGIVRRGTPSAPPSPTAAS